MVRRETDTNANEVIDLWELSDPSGRRILRAESRGRCSLPNILFLFGADGESVAKQEEDRNCNGRPDRLTRFASDGNVEFRCTIRQEIHFEMGTPVEVWEDSEAPYSGFADQRQIFEEGTLLRVEADTNEDRMPDVWIRYEGDRATVQDEDSDFDGKIDRRFDLATNKPVPLSEPLEPLSIERMRRIRCTGFNAFWKDFRQNGSRASASR